MACGGGGGSLVPDSFLGGEEQEEEEQWGKIYSKLNQDVIKREPPSPVNNIRNKQEGEDYIMYGVKVAFPYAAYSSQKQLMSQSIKGVKKVQNCLLESPTGTGKTAALLCALLGWQRYCKESNLSNSDFAKQAVTEAGSCTCGFMPKNLVGKPTIEKYTSSSYTTRFRLCVTYFTEDEDKNDAASPTKMETKRESKSRKRDKDLLCRHCVMSHFFKPTIPKIFYTTRTHSQVQQVVDQLKGTAYRNVKMTILASRKIACINTEVIEDAKEYEARFQQKGNNNKDSLSSSPNKRARVTTTRLDENDEDSGRTLDDSCRILKRNYFWNLKKEAAQSLKYKPLPVCKFFQSSGDLELKLRDSLSATAWDIEDLKRVGQECMACPYYGSQALYEDAEIVFCPYNYVISPSIRSAVGIDLVGNIIVFDEAHNLEDICRDEASTTFDLNRLDGSIRVPLDAALFGGGPRTSKRAAAEHFSMLLRNLSTWMRNSAPKVTEPNIYSTQSCSTDAPQHIVFKDERMIEIFEKIGLGKDEMGTNHSYLASLTDADEMDDDDEDEKEDKKFDVPSVVSRFIEKLLGTLCYMYDDENYKHFNIVLVNNGEPIKPMAKEKVTHPISSQLKINNKPTPSTPLRREYNVSLEIMCLSPALVFKTIRDQAHSIIVSSGTLTPLNSFAAELNTPFQIRLIADHVIQTFQTFSCCVMSGLNKKLELNMVGQRDVEIQDDLGQTILQICSSVPHGVLVFLPSYTFMDTLKERWSRGSHQSSTSILKQLEFFKHIFFEERKDKQVFEKDMQNFKDRINQPLQNSSQTGCLLFAIFRGKVSEGINFTDDQSRAVITVGIPFSNFGAYAIKYKREYNDARIKNAKNAVQQQDSAAELLSGDQWYNTQAFRAMNQAFGRCIRHKNDWGAIIMLDWRMSRESNKSQLSQWVKAEMKVFGNFDAMKNKLASFVQDRLMNKNPPVPERSNKNDEDLLNTSFESVEDLMDIDESSNLKQGNHTQLTQVTNKLKLAKSNNKNLPIGKNNKPSSSSCSNNKKKEVAPVVVDLDSSSYSLDESDCLDDRFPSLCHNPIISVHDLPTQVILQPNTIITISSDDDDLDISYHSSTSSSDIIEGTP